MLSTTFDDQGSRANDPDLSVVFTRSMAGLSSPDLSYIIHGNGYFSQTAGPYSFCYGAQSSLCISTEACAFFLPHISLLQVPPCTGRSLSLHRSSRHFFFLSQSTEQQRRVLLESFVCQTTYSGEEFLVISVLG